MFRLARECISTSQNAVKNTFPLDGKIKLVLSGRNASNWKKQVVSTSQKINLSQKIIRNEVIFQILDLPVSTNRNNKSLNKRILFQLDRKKVSTSGNGEFV